MILYGYQIPDDFLGRSVLHFDLTDTNPETRACVVSEYLCVCVGGGGRLKESQQVVELILCFPN